MMEQTPMASAQNSFRHRATSWVRRGLYIATALTAIAPAAAREPRIEERSREIRESRVDDRSGSSRESVREVREVRTEQVREVKTDTVRESRTEPAREPKTETRTDVKIETRTESHSGSGSGSSETDTRTRIESGSRSDSGSTTDISDRSGSNKSGSSSSGSSDDNSGSGSNRSGSSNSGSSEDNSGSGSNRSGSSNSGSSDDSSGSNSGSGNDDTVDNSVSGSASMKGLAAREQPQFDPGGFPVRRGEVLALGADPAALKQMETRGFAVLEKINVRGLGTQMYRLSVPKDLPPGQALKALRDTDKNGTYDYDHYYAAENSVPAEMSEKNVQAFSAHAHAAFRAQIGVIDAPILNHTALKNAKVEMRNFSHATDRSKPASSLSDHGLGVASILVNRGARNIVSANVFRGDAARPYTDAAAIAAALNWMVEKNIPVINISIAGPPNAALDRLVQMVSSKGHAIVAAAGNQGPTAPPAYPAASAGAVAVTAVDENKQVYRMANRGPFIRYAAPGVHVLTASGKGLTYRSGTSFAAAHVSAALAACMGKASPRAASTCLARMDREAKDLGEPGRDPVYGIGLIDD
jgi:Subtilase family